MTPHPKSSGRIRAAASRVVNSAIDAVLDNIWSVVIATITPPLMTALTAIGVYLFLGKASWLYASLKYVAVFLAGFLAFGVLLLLLALIGLYRQNRERKRDKLKYVSTQKGYLDYRAELMPAGKRFQQTTSEIAQEMGRGSKLASRIAVILPYFEFNPLWARRFMSLGARSYRKHAMRLERLAKKLEKTGAAVVEVSHGNLRWAQTASQGNKEQLLAFQQALMVVDQSLSESITSLNNYRNLAIPVKNISRDMGTAVNYLIAVVDKHVTILEQIKSAYAECFNVLRTKLSS